jgi:hypothetical protein
VSASWAKPVQQDGKHREDRNRAIPAAAADDKVMSLTGQVFRVKDQERAPSRGAHAL